MTSIDMAREVSEGRKSEAVVSFTGEEIDEVFRTLYEQFGIKIGTLLDGSPEANSIIDELPDHMKELLTFMKGDEERKAIFTLHDTYLMSLVQVA